MACAIVKLKKQPFLFLQAPLLAYNHFVEALFVLNDCRAGLHGGGSAALISDSDSAEAGESNLAQLQGSSPSARAKRGAIYRSAAVLHVAGRLAYELVLVLGCVTPHTY